jgi:glycerol-3-phosphate dehydrogenase
MATGARLGQPLAAEGPTVGAEVIYAIRHEMAVRLSDIVIRRLGLGAAGHPGATVVRAAASVAAEELGWDTSRLGAEIADVNRFFRISD